MPESPVRELRLAMTVENYDEAVRFYRDALGLPVIEEWEQETGSGAILDAGRATLELLSVDQSDLVDRIEVGEVVSGPIRLALEVEDSEEAAKALVAGGAQKVGGPVVTPWSHRNVRVRAPDGMQLTLFTLVGGVTEAASG
jgi:lactoylglutathione lyase